MCNSIMFKNVHALHKKKLFIAKKVLTVIWDYWENGVNRLAQRRVAVHLQCVKHTRKGSTKKRGVPIMT